MKTFIKNFSVNFEKCFKVVVAKFKVVRKFYLRKQIKFRNKLKIKKPIKFSKLYEQIELQVSKVYRVVLSEAEKCTVRQVEEMEKILNIDGEKIY